MLILEYHQQTDAPRLVVVRDAAFPRGFAARYTRIENHRLVAGN